MTTISRSTNAAARLRRHLMNLAGLLVLLCAAPHVLAQAARPDPPMPFDAAANPGIKKLVLLKSSAPSLINERMGGVMVFRQGENPAENRAVFATGAIGGAIAGSMNQTQPNSREVAAHFKALGFEPQEWYTSRVKEALERAGYEVRVATVERPYTTKFIANLAGVAGPDETVLDLGLLIPSLMWSEDKYVPNFVCIIRLVRADGKEMVYRGVFAYMQAKRETAAGVKKITVDEKYSFESFQAILEKDKLAAEALQTGLQGIADGIAVDLKPAPAAKPN